MSQSADLLGLCLYEPRVLGELCEQPTVLLLRKSVLHARRLYSRHVMLPVITGMTHGSMLSADMTHWSMLYADMTATSMLYAV